MKTLHLDSEPSCCLFTAGGCLNVHWIKDKNSSAIPDQIISAIQSFSAVFISPASYQREHCAGESGSPTVSSKWIGEPDYVQVQCTRTL